MKIDKGIPLPEGGLLSFSSKYDFVREMEYGDSVQTNNDSEKQGVRYGILASDSYSKVVTRSRKDEKGKTFWRIWKLKLNYDETRTCSGCGQVVRPKQEGESL